MNQEFSPPHPQPNARVCAIIPNRCVIAKKIRPLVVIDLLRSFDGDVRSYNLHLTEQYCIVK
jgi:hypothetical protein